MELRRYLAIVRRRSLLVVLTVAVAMGVAWARTPRLAVYEARATIYVGARQFSNPNGGGVSNDQLAGVERLTTTFAVMIHSEPIAADALERTKLDRSASAVVAGTAVEVVQDTQLLRIRYYDADPAIARDLANALAEAFVEKVQTFEPSAPATEGTVPSLPAYVFERASLPLTPSQSGVARNVVVAGMFGLAAAVGLALLLEYLDITIKGAADATARLDLPVLGTIPYETQVPPPRPDSGRLRATSDA